LKKFLLTLIMPLLFTGCIEEKDLVEYKVNCEIEVINSSGLIDTVSYQKFLCLSDEKVKLRHAGNNKLFLDYHSRRIFPKSDLLKKDIIKYRILENISLINTNN